MDNSTHLQYLQAMGIDVWQAKDCKLVENSTDNWQQLSDEVSQCQHCELCQHRHQTVFGSGNQQADWLIVGEAPGEQEDLQGQPFIGVAGKLLTEMLRAIHLSREQIFITNIIKCRPPNDRNPHKNEAAACANYLQRQIALLKPKIILAVGRIAAQQLLETHAPLGELRGTVHYLETLPVVVVYHPAYLLRKLTEKRKAWDDLQLALNTFENTRNLP